MKFFGRLADKESELGKMISLRNSMSDLDQCHQARDLALDCYLGAIRNIAHYAVEMDPAVTSVHRKYLEDLAALVSGGSVAALNESRATLRGVLREYREQSSQYLSKLRAELSDAVSALQQTLDSLGQSDGDHDKQLRSTIAKLRGIPDVAGGEIRQTVLAAAANIETSLEQVRKQHKLTVSQFLMEIRMLHSRIDAMESAASIDKLTQLFNRDEMEERIKGARTPKLSLLLLKTGGLRAAESQFGAAVAEELAGAFTKRLRNSLPPAAVIGRWSEEEFLALLPVDQFEATGLAKRISETLAGAYACLKSGKTVRPLIRLRVGVVDPGTDAAEKVLQRIGEFLNAG
jgi:GGDEF domain-containing protein